MQRRKLRKPRVKGRFWHTYRVVVEKVAHQSVVILATSRGDAESRAYDFVGRHPENWVDEETSVRDCTSVLMADGSWEFCNALDSDPDDDAVRDMVPAHECESKKHVRGARHEG